MNKQLLSLLSVIVLISLGLWAFSSLREDEVKDEIETVKTEVMEATDKASSALDQGETAENTNPLNTIIGTKQGVATLVLSSLTFPDSTMITNSDQSFTLDADGLNLALLQNQAFEVAPGVYPIVKVNTTGIVNTNPEGVELQLSSLTPDFYTTDAAGAKTSLDAATQQKIAAGLQAAGINIPVITEANPVTLPVTVSTNTDGTFEIESTAKSPIFARFDSK